MRNDLGARLRQIRASRNQQEMADVLAVAKRTYASYERNERVPEALALVPLLQEGWNGNWLLTGEGPERLEDLQGKGIIGAETPATPESQPVSHDNVRIAVQLLREAEATYGAKPSWTPKQQAEATSILVRLLEIGLDSAEVHSIARQHINLMSEGQYSDARSRSKGVGK